MLCSIQTRLSRYFQRETKNRRIGGLYCVFVIVITCSWVKSYITIIVYARKYSSILLVTTESKSLVVKGKYQFCKLADGEQADCMQDVQAFEYWSSKCQHLLLKICNIELSNQRGLIKPPLPMYSVTSRLSCIHGLVYCMVAELEV